MTINSGESGRKTFKVNVAWDDLLPICNGIFALMRPFQQLLGFLLSVLLTITFNLSSSSPIDFIVFCIYLDHLC